MADQTARRAFLTTVAVGTAVPLSMAIGALNGNPLNLPIGAQLFAVGDEMDAAPLGTLKQLAAIGYKQVELSPISKVPAERLRQAIREAGLANPSGHYLLSDLMSNLPQKIELAKQFGQQYMVVPLPWVADPSRVKSNPQNGPLGFIVALTRGLTLDDWKWNAEQFNKIGEQVHKAGLQLAYHNHNFDFKSYNGVTGYDELLRQTDPALVKLEMDCGWMVVAGQNPVMYLEKYPDRYRLLHIKDFRKGFVPSTALMDQGRGAPIPTELGRGAIDYHAIFSAATCANSWYFCRTGPAVQGHTRIASNENRLRVPEEFPFVSEMGCRMRHSENGVCVDAVFLRCVCRQSGIY